MTEAINCISVCVVTGSRSEYSHLFYIIKQIEASPSLNLQLVVTGMHLSSDFGDTIGCIKQDGFTVTKEIPILIPGDHKVAITKSIGKGVTEFADVFEELAPDIVLVLGDRFEILAVVTAAVIAGIPIAHIGGGDVTEGAFDDVIRHSITKMSHIHFVTNELSKKRVVQMGENPEHVYMVGAPSIDAINDMSFLDKHEFFTKVGFHKCYEKYILVTYHPETLSNNALADDIAILLEVMAYYKDAGIIITGANADTGGNQLNKILQTYATGNDNVVFHLSLGKELFYNALKHVDVFVGNSSSGLYEAPYFKLPVVNIGDRQKNRLSAASVINCSLVNEAILEAIEKAFHMDCSNVTGSYGHGNVSARVVKVLEGIKKPQQLLRKTFYGE